MVFRDVEAIRMVALGWGYSVARCQGTEMTCILAFRCGFLQAYTSL